MRLPTLSTTAVCTVLMAATLPMLLTGCSPVGARAGVSTGPAFLYKRVITPMRVSRPAGPPGAASGIPIPQELVRHEVATYQLSLSLPFVGPPGSGSLFTIGWGDMSTRRLLEESDNANVVFADAEDLSILGIYNRTTIIAYATPPEPPADPATTAQPAPAR